MSCNKKCCISGCNNKSTKTKIIFGVFYNFCSDHGIIDLKKVEGLDY